MTRPLGFTLLELIIVVAIIGAVTALVLPQFSVSHTGTQTELLKLKHFVESARAEAMNTGDALSLVLTQKPNQPLEVEIFPQKPLEQQDDIFAGLSKPAALRRMTLPQGFEAQLEPPPQQGVLTIYLGNDGLMDGFQVQAGGHSLTYNGTPLTGVVE